MDEILWRAHIPPISMINVAVDAQPFLQQAREGLPLHAHYATSWDGVNDLLAEYITPRVDLVSGWIHGFFQERHHTTVLISGNTAKGTRIRNPHKMHGHVRLLLFMGLQNSVEIRTAQYVTIENHGVIVAQLIHHITDRTARTQGFFFKNILDL